jgi:hypothetical protein
MSGSRNQKIKCPAKGCGEIFEAEIWYSVNVKTEPVLKEILRAGELNIVRCPGCGTMSYAEQFVLYLDPDWELLAFVYPKEYEKERAIWEKKMNEEYERSQDEAPEGEKLSYPPMIFFGMDELLNLVEFEELQRDELEVLESIHKNLGLGLVRLKHSYARGKKLPPVLPVTMSGGEKPLNERIIAGLKKLLDFMPDMEIYRKTFEKSKDDLSLQSEYCISS